MGTEKSDSQADETLEQRFEQWLVDLVNRASEKGYRTGYYNGFVAAFPCGYREAVRDKSIPFMHTGWDEVPEEIYETGCTYCETVMTVLHMGKEPGWALLPFEKFWEKKAERGSPIDLEKPDPEHGSAA